MGKVLVLGASGLVGSALIHEWKDGYKLYGTYSSSSLSSLPFDHQFQLDVQQIEKMKEMIQVIKPDFVISCLRGDFDNQFRFHKELVKVLRNTSSRLYYFSTTNVFDGDFSRPHTETDTPIAESDYGKFKIKCENMLKEILDEQVIIIRIPAIWGKTSPRLNLIKESIKENKEIDVYSNLVCNNLSDALLAKQLRYIMEKELKGTFHLSSMDMVTQEEFYRQIISGFSNEKNILQNHLYQDKAENFYFCLHSNREDIPASLRVTNKDIISYLLN
ncbi:sugar nucleotide-binding protein [Shimazuella kribbensis]|uniref:sugar nucleotide-binding protein n=1 Tax=Shimazuella kribbensis TaxID=139808 RepID=UPI00040BF52B|nr:sugar nucleotide-binding protein [Shimazuella kribbensis]